MVGTPAYEIEGVPVRAVGLVLDEECVARISPDVQAVLCDERGVSEAREALDDLPKTAFQISVLESVLAPRSNHDEWRVGEAVAEVHLTQDEGCEFPWPDSRSVRNPNSSSGGVDLVGVQVADRVRFVFAEVKTSHQLKWPPSVVTSRSHGLHGQLAGLIAGDARLLAAIRYLVMNGNGRPWFDKVRAACQTFLADQSDIALFGVLVHATEAKRQDLETIATRLGELHAEPTTSALVGLYVAPELLGVMADAEIILETAA